MDFPDNLMSSWLWYFDTSNNVDTNEARYYLIAFTDYTHNHYRCYDIWPQLNLIVLLRQTRDVHRMFEVYDCASRIESITSQYIKDHYAGRHPSFEWILAGCSSIHPEHCTLWASRVFQRVAIRKFWKSNAFSPNTSRHIRIWRLLYGPPFALSSCLPSPPASSPRIFLQRMMEFRSRRKRNVPFPWNADEQLQPTVWIT